MTDDIIALKIEGLYSEKIILILIFIKELFKN